jgi:hypothetical protein
MYRIPACEHRPRPADPERLQPQPARGTTTRTPHFPMTAFRPANWGSTNSNHSGDVAT